jgi:hypothetical protein
MTDNGVYDSRECYCEVVGFPVCASTSPLSRAHWSVWIRPVTVSHGEGGFIREQSVIDYEHAPSRDSSATCRTRACRVTGGR